jgi:hypothetical protein
MRYGIHSDHHIYTDGLWRLLIPGSIVLNLSLHVWLAPHTYARTVVSALLSEVAMPPVAILATKLIVDVSKAAWEFLKGVIETPTRT